jgi:hypothetical protein
LNGLAGVTTLVVLQGKAALVTVTEVVVVNLVVTCNWDKSISV